MSNVSHQEVAAGFYYQWGDAKEMQLYIENSNKSIEKYPTIGHLWCNLEAWNTQASWENWIK
mgnify:CR=1 FL=1